MNGSCLILIFLLMSMKSIQEKDGHNKEHNILYEFLMIM